MRTTLRRCWAERRARQRSLRRSAEEPRRRGEAVSDSVSCTNMIQSHTAAEGGALTVRVWVRARGARAEITRRASIGGSGAGGAVHTACRRHKTSLSVPASSLRAAPQVRRRLARCPPRARRCPPPPRPYRAPSLCAAPLAPISTSRLGCAFFAPLRSACSPCSHGIILGNGQR